MTLIFSLFLSAGAISSLAIHWYRKSAQQQYTLAQNRLGQLHREGNGVKKDFAKRNGTIPGGQMAVIALGSFGGRELTQGSDLDLVLLYDAKPDAASKKGKGLPASQSQDDDTDAPETWLLLTAQLICPREHPVDVSVLRVQRSAQSQIHRDQTNNAASGRLRFPGRVPNGQRRS